MARQGAGVLGDSRTALPAATDPDALKDVSDPIGPDNDGWIAYAAAEAETVICAWGNKGGDRRASEVVERIRRHANLVRLGPLTNKGQPSHPLFLPKSIQWESMADYRSHA